MSDYVDWRLKHTLEKMPAYALRARLDALAKLRDASNGWSQRERDHIRHCLAGYTDAVLHALMQKELGAKYEPYPHPLGEGPFDGDGP